MNTRDRPGIRIARLLTDPGVSSVLIAALAAVVLAGTLLDAAGYAWAKTLYGWPCGILLSLIALQSLAASIIRFVHKDAGFRMTAALVVSHLGLSLLIVGALISALTSREYVLGIAEGAESSEAFYRDGWDIGIAVDDIPRSFPLESLREGDTIHADVWTVKLSSLKLDGSLPELLLEASSPSIVGQELLLKGGAVGGALGAKQIKDLSGSRLVVMLEPRKTELPFSVTLDDFEIRSYPHTAEAADYISTVRIGLGESSETARISMNQPLRVAGYVLYQSSWEELGEGRMASVLLVQYRPFSELPYIGAIVLGLGLAWYPFTRRSKKQVRPIGLIVSPAGTTWRGLVSVVAVICLAMVTTLGASLRVPQANIDVGGRVQPLSYWLDRAVSHLGFENAVGPDPRTGNVSEEDTPERFKKLFMENPREISRGAFLAVPASILGEDKGADFSLAVSLEWVLASWQTIGDRLDETTRDRITLLSDLSSVGDAFYRSGYFSISDELRGVLGLPKGAVSFVELGRALRNLALASNTAPNTRVKPLSDRLESEFSALAEAAQGFAKRYEALPIRVVRLGEETLRPIDLVWAARQFESFKSDRTDLRDGIIRATAGLDTFAENTWKDFFANRVPFVMAENGRPNVESVYRSIPFLPFSVSAILLALICMLAHAAMPAGRLASPLSSVLKGFAVAGIAISTFTVSAQVALRVAASGLPPVSSLESSLLFVSALMLLCALWFCFTNRALAFAGGTAFLALAVYIVHALVLGTGDEFAPVIAVLNTPLWLAVHVSTITAGYALVLIGSVLAHIRLFGIFRHGEGDGIRGISKLDSAQRAFMVAGLACTAMGTILGGFWADQSWGRFWGWDPKENGALIIVLWSAFVLHRWAAGSMSLLRFAALNAWSLSPLVFSWFGINFLGKGLHSYGFSDGPVIAIVAVVVAETAVLAFAVFYEYRQSARRARELESIGAVPARLLSVEMDKGGSFADVWFVYDQTGPRLRGGDSVRVSFRHGARWVSRAYSVSGRTESPDGRPKHRLTVKPSGPRSLGAYFTRLPTGTRIFVQGPFGDLGNLVGSIAAEKGIAGLNCIAFGIGAAPVLGLLDELRDAGKTAEIDIWYAGDDGIGAALTAASEGHAQCRVHILVPGRRLTIADAIASGKGNRLWVVCGAPDALADLDAERREVGIADEVWFAEAFSASAFDPPAHLEKRAVLLQPSRIVVNVPPGTTVLSAIASNAVARRALDSKIFGGCGIGRCGTCSARLKSGVLVHAEGVEHRDSVKLCAAWPESDCEIDFS